MLHFTPDICIQFCFKIDVHELLCDINYFISLVSNMYLHNSFKKSPLKYVPLGETQFTMNCFEISNAPSEWEDKSNISQASHTSFYKK